MGIKIPKKIGHIWVGNEPAPEDWMDTWKNHHKDWEYTLYDNDFYMSFNFKTRHLIDRYLALGMYAGASDLMRYEILYHFGGFIPEADSICYCNTDELFIKTCAYTVYENEFLRGKLVSPIYACEPQNKFVGSLIEELLKLSPDDLGPAWKTTGNLFVAKMIEKYQPDITIFPSYYFIPVHFEGMVYSGNGKVYAKQLFGSTRGAYPKKNSNWIVRKIYKFKTKKKRASYIKLFEKKEKEEKAELFGVDYNNGKF